MSDGVLTRMGMIEIWQWYGTTEYRNPQHTFSHAHVIAITHV